MSQPNGLLILGDHLFLNYKKNGQRGLIYTAGIINPNLTLYTYHICIYVCLYIYMRVCVCMHACVFTYMRICIYEYVNMGSFGGHII